MALLPPLRWVHASVYLGEDQHSVPLIFQFPQHLLHQRQFPRSLSEGRPLVRTAGGLLGFLPVDTNISTQEVNVC